MSTKSTKKAPKLPPMEAIVTRNRSAQLRRQLRNSDRSMKKIIQITTLLRSPNKNETSPAKSPKKHQEPKKVHKSPKVTQKSPKNVNGNEFYPNKLKRMVKAKKVLLKPKHEMKSIAVGVGKRKLGVPQKETKSSSPIKRMKTEPLRHSDLSMVELVRMSDESDTLNDEDLMEILTCESPVWWEDPPDEGYIEDPIFLRDEAIETHSDHWSLKKGRKYKSIPKMYKAEQHNTEDNSLKPLESKKSDDKFMKKRTKLENLLSNIKNKLNTETEGTEIGWLVTNHEVSTDTVANFDQDKSKVIKIVEIDKTNDKANVNKRITNENSAEGNKNMAQMNRNNKSQSESEGEDIFSGFRDDEILRDLENMDIPIGETNNGCEDSSSKTDKKIKCSDTLKSNEELLPVNTGVDSTHVKSEDIPVKIENKSLEVENFTLQDCSYTESKELKIEIDKMELEMQETESRDINNTELSRKNTVKDKNLTTINEDSCKKELLDKDLKDPVADISNPSKDTPEYDNIPTTLPILQKNPINNIEKITASPISLKSVISEDCYETSSLVSNPDAMDTISDTNIHFIDDDDSSKHSEESLRETEKSEAAAKDHVNENIEIVDVDMSLSKVEGNDDKISLDESEERKPESSESIPLKLKLLSSAPKIKECMTVYKIITGDNMALNSKETDVKLEKGSEELTSNQADKDIKCYEKVEYQNGNLNAFFKIRKSSYRRRPRKIETIVSDTQKTVNDTQNKHLNKKDTTETILVSNTNNVKYCRKCSSIFDTEICGYCNKETRECSRIKTVDKQYSCDLCEFRTSCKSAIVQHVTDHD